MILGSGTHINLGGGARRSPARLEFSRHAASGASSIVSASYFRKITPDVTAALEWSFWDLRTREFTSTGALGPRGTSGRGNVLNIALTYQF